jgi:hypothetical protein
MNTCPQLNIIHGGRRAPGGPKKLEALCRRPPCPLATGRDIGVFYQTELRGLSKRKSFSTPNVSHVLPIKKREEVIGRHPRANFFWEGEALFRRTLLAFCCFSYEDRGKKRNSSKVMPVRSFLSQLSFRVMKGLLSGFVRYSIVYG